MQSFMLFLLLNQINFVGSQTFEWAKSFGSANDEQVQAIGTDAQGNVYVAGFFQGTIDFDPGPATANLVSSSSSTDIFICKMSSTGEFIWAKRMGGPGYDIPREMYVDPSGNVFTTGIFQNSADFDPGAASVFLTSSGNYDVFISKLNTAGEYVWAKKVGGSLNDQAYSIVCDQNQNVYATGTFSGTSDFNPGSGTFNISSNGNSDAYILKLDQSGNFLWAKNLGNVNQTTQGQDITIGSSGSVYCVGRFGGTVDFDFGPGTNNLTSNGGLDVYVTKLNQNGDFIWARSWGGIIDDWAEDIAVDEDENVLTTGSFYDAVDFNPGGGSSFLNSNGDYDIFISKLNSNGNYVWAKNIGGSSSDFGQSIAVDQSGNVYTTGAFGNTVDFNPGGGTFQLSATGGASDLFVVKLNSNGNFSWAFDLGESLTDYGLSIVVDNQNTIYTGGFFQGTVDLNPFGGAFTWTSVGLSDGFVQKLSQCQNNSGTDEITSCIPITWIDGLTYSTSNNSATYTLTNSGGCDSLVTLNLTINSVSDLSTSVSGLTIAANNTNASYQWLDCDNNFALLSGETDQTFTASENGLYAVELSENGCVDTSLCVLINTISIDENDFFKQLHFYPNPSNGELNFDLGSDFSNLTIAINDQSGREIYSVNRRKVQKLNLQLDLPSGFYLVRIVADQNSAIVKLLIE